jgi:hypothetical protein
LTAFQMTPRLAVAVLALVAILGIVAQLLGTRWPWALRCTVAVLLLALCALAIVTLGALPESLSAAVDKAQRTAADWIGIPGAQADAALLRDVARLTGVRGFEVEAYGGLANEDEERWLGPQPSSGVFYGTQSFGGEGTLSIPYRTAYWRGGPLDPEKWREAVVGYDLAQRHGLQIGDAITVREVPFTVVGIREPVRHDPQSDVNYRIDISMEALRQVLRDPFAMGELTLVVPPATDPQDKAIFLQEVASRLRVGRILTVEDRAAAIARGYPAAWTVTSLAAQESTRHARAAYSGSFLLCTAVLLLASGLAVSGAMVDRLVRDEQRIGLLKALGSDEGMLLGDYLQMAAVCGLLGAVPGVLGGWIASGKLNSLASDGSAKLLFTPQLGASVLFLVVITAIVAAIVPVSQAIRQSATRALYSASPTQIGASSGTVVHGGSGL